MSIGFWQIAIVVVLVVLLFGRGKISDLMGDVAKGIKSFKKGISENPDSSNKDTEDKNNSNSCLLYTSPSPRDLSTSRMPSSA